MRFCLRLVVPTFFDLVSEHGLRLGNSTLMPALQVLPQALTDDIEHEPGRWPLDDDLVLHGHAEDVWGLEDLM